MSKAGSFSLQKRVEREVSDEEVVRRDSRLRMPKRCILPISFLVKEYKKLLRER